MEDERITMEEEFKKSSNAKTAQDLHNNEIGITTQALCDSAASKRQKLTTEGFAKAGVSRISHKPPPITNTEKKSVDDLTVDLVSGRVDQLLFSYGLSSNFITPTSKSTFVNPTSVASGISNVAIDYDNTRDIMMGNLKEYIGVSSFIAELLEKSGTSTELLTFDSENRLNQIGLRIIIGVFCEEDKLFKFDYFKQEIMASFEHKSVDLPLLLKAIHLTLKMYTKN